MVQIYSALDIVGGTFKFSTEATFPVTVGPDLTFNGRTDAFVAKIGLGPAISSISPSSAIAGTAGFTLMVNGSDFVAGAVVRWNGADRVTTFVSSTELQASIPASDIAVAGTAQVTVFNPLPGGGISNVVVFNVLVFNPEGGCVNIAGVWEVEETGTLACTLTAGDETETSTDPIGGSGSVMILQEPGACSFSYDRALPGGGTVVRNGEIVGDMLTFSGVAAVPLPGETLTSNILEATGQVQGDVINVSGSGLIEGTIPAPEAPGGIVNLSCIITTTAVFSRSAPAPFTSAGLVHAARFEAGDVAEQEIVSLFGLSLADFNADAVLPLGTQLGGASVDVTDSQGVTRPCLMFAARVETDVSSAQLNFIIAAGTATGPATLTVRRASGGSHSITINVVEVAPGIFTANASGSGVPAANALRFVDGELTDTSLVFDLTAFPFQATPIDLGPENHQVFLSLFLTGVRNGSTVQVTIDGVPMTTIFGPAPSSEFEGLEQLNVLLERVLIGRGLVQVVVTVDGIVANVVEINILS